MRTLMPADATLLGYWAQPAEAAFIAATPDRKQVLSAVKFASGATIRRDGRKVTGEGKAIDSLDLEGLIVGPWVVLFHTEPVLARSVLSFDSEKEGTKFLLTGLAAGSWEVWRNGWNMDTFEVKPREGVLYFEGRPGSYFLRPLS
jgi:hypothetical protein